uniref:Stork_head domain-containing protein n=1 Tax=Heterorhabditis bacteriophora TaxID=37862 RepID=A0A1I7XDA6_HETBA
MGAIQTVEQMHFVPLGDVICDSIAHLNRLGQPATIAAVRSHVAHYCPHVAPPNIDMVKQTVANLITTGLVYKMGEHFFVSVPAQSPPKNKVTVQCQTGLYLHHHDEVEIRKSRRHRKCERRQLSSSSECLNYGPIDPPECLPGHVEVVPLQMMMEQELPDEYDWFAEQIAGHHPSVIKNGKREIEHEFLILQDVTAPFQYPAILDIKMGRVTFDPQASAAKREKESAKYPPQKSLGFRLLGYRVNG